MRGSPRQLVNLLLILTLLIAAFVVSIWLFARFAGQERPYSSYGAQPEGGKAFYLLLQEMGRDIQRFSAPVQQLPAGAGMQTLIFTEPARRGVSAREAETLYRWVEEGNRMLLLSVRQPALLEAFGLEAIFPDNPNQVVLTLIENEHPLLEGVNRLEINRTAFFTSPSGGETLVEFEEEIYVLMKKIGSGEFIAIADPEIITNRRIARADNIILLLNAAGTTGEAPPLLYNERHHQFGLPQPAPDAARQDGIFSYLPWVAVQFALFTLLLLFTLGRRFGVPRPLPEKARRSPVDFVFPAAAVWQKARARRLTVEILYQGLIRRIARKYRLGHVPELKELAALGERVTGRTRRQWEKDFLRLAEAAQNEQITAAEMIMATRRIDCYRKELIG